MGPGGPVSLILVSSHGWKSLASGFPIGLQAIFYIQYKKALLHFIQFFKGLFLLFWKLISFIWNVVLQLPYTKLCCGVMKWMLQIFPSLFLFVYSVFSSEKLFSIIYYSYAHKNNLFKIKLLWFFQCILLKNVSLFLKLVWAVFHS